MYEYNEDRHDQSTEYDYIGQNIVATDETSVNYTILLGKWFKQRSKYNYYTGGCQNEDGEEMENLEGCEGYSQVYIKLYNDAYYVFPFRCIYYYYSKFCTICHFIGSTIMVEIPCISSILCMVCAYVCFIILH